MACVMYPVIQSKSHSFGVLIPKMAKPAIMKREDEIDVGCIKKHAQMGVGHLPSGILSRKLELPHDFGPQGTMRQ